MTKRIYLVSLVLIIGFYACNPTGKALVYDYSLIDINPNSDFNGINISPGYFENQITLHYFGHQG